MKQKFRRFSNISFIWSVSIFVLSFFFYHYVTVDGRITTVFQDEAGKPFVALLLSILGVLFLFSGIVCRLIPGVFFPEETAEKK